MNVSLCANHPSMKKKILIRDMIPQPRKKPLFKPLTTAV